MSSWASGKADLAKMQEKSVAEINSLKLTIMKRRVQLNWQERKD